MSHLKIYLAGPDVFLPDAIAVGDRKKALCAQYAFEGMYPFDNEAIAKDGEALDVAIFYGNVDMIFKADIVIANLTPFRGPSADAGTVFEVGMAYGLGKEIYAYTNETRDLADRTVRMVGGGYNTRTIENGRDVWRDPADMLVEDFDNADNLMIDGAVEETGYPIVRVSVPDEVTFTDLRGFEACLKLAQARTR